MFMLLFVTAVPHVCVVFTALLPMCVVFLLTTYSSVTKQFACVWCVCTLYFVVFIPSNVGIRKAQRRIHADARRLGQRSSSGFPPLSLTIQA